MDNWTWYQTQMIGVHNGNELLQPLSYSFLNTCLFPLTYNRIKTDDENLRARLTYLAYERRIVSLTGDILKLSKIDKEIFLILDNYWTDIQSRLFFNFYKRYELSSLVHQFVINKNLSTYIYKLFDINKMIAPHKNKTSLNLNLENKTLKNTTILLNGISDLIGKDNEIFLMIQKIFNPEILDSILSTINGMNTLFSTKIFTNNELKHLSESSNIRVLFKLLISNVQKSLFISVNDSFKDMISEKEILDLNGYLSVINDENKFIVLGYLNNFLRSVKLSSMIDFDLKLDNTVREILLDRYQLFNRNSKFVVALTELWKLDSLVRLNVKYTLKELQRASKEGIIFDNFNIERETKIIDLLSFKILFHLKKLGHLSENLILDMHSKIVQKMETFDINPELNKIIKLIVSDKRVSQKKRNIFISQLKRFIRINDKKFVVLHNSIFLDILKKNADIFYKLIKVDKKSRNNIEMKLVIVDLKAEKKGQVDSKVFLNIKGNSEIFIDLEINTDKHLSSKLIDSFNELKSIESKIRTAYCDGIYEIDHIIRNVFPNLNTVIKTKKNKITEKSILNYGDKYKITNIDKITSSIKNKIANQESIKFSSKEKFTDTAEINLLDSKIRNIDLEKLIETNRITDHNIILSSIKELDREIKRYGSISKILSGDKLFKDFDLKNLIQLQKLYKDVIILSEESKNKYSKFKHSQMINTKEENNLFKNMKDIHLDLKNSILELYYIKDITLMYDFVYTEMFKRWYFLPTDGPKDWMILPLDYPYSTLPINGINEHPLPNGQDKALVEVAVNIYMIIDVLDFCFELWKSNSFLYTRYNPEQALKHFLNLLYSWMDSQVPDTIYKMPSYYPEDYDILSNTLDDREDYWRIYRWIRWYTEALVMNIPEQDRNLSGNVYVEKLIDDLVTYFDSHHGVYKSPFEEGNTLIDKIKGVRHKWLELNKKLN